MKNLLKTNDNKLEIVKIMILLAISLLLYSQLQLSVAKTARGIVGMEMLSNSFFLFVIIFFLWNLFPKGRMIVLPIIAIINTLWSAVGYYVLLFHQSPLCISELRNFGTAMDVLGNYDIKIQKRVVLILGISIVLGILIYLLYKVDKLCWAEKGKLIKRNKKVCILATVLLLSYGTFFVLEGLTTVSWNKRAAVELKGYMGFFVADAVLNLNPYVKPNGYNPKKVELNTSSRWDVEQGNTKPDIILIVNESFADLTAISNLETDKDPLEAFYGIENAIYGFSEVSWPGGGTNNSEYELLTSNSMKLLSGGAPFTFVKFGDYGSNVVSYLKKAGYETFAFHCYSDTNYARNTAYVDMGFDNIYLGKDMFSECSYNGKRIWLDEGNYKDLIRVYENKETDAPRFMYMLTYQNHGGYFQNDNDMDTIHTLSDYGALNEQINEYLTSVELSAKAFRELTDYYKTVDRPVIICMVGDHTPSFTEELLSQEEQGEYESAINARMVPYVIWSNYDIDYVPNIENVTMVDLMPIVLYSAQIPLSSYYKQILDLQQKIPIRVYYGIYCDKDGTYGYYEDNQTYKAMWDSYLYSEYNGIVGGKDYYESLFEGTNESSRSNNSKN